MSKTAQEEIKRIVNSGLKPVLKELDYLKNGNTWNLRDGELIKVVNVQLSSGNLWNKAKFTINLGIFSYRFHSESPFGGRINEKNIKEYDCEIRERISSVCKTSDLWWTVSVDGENEKVLEEVKQKFTDFAIPWLNSFKNLEDEYNYFVEHQDHQSAFIAAYVLGKDSVLQHLREEIKDANVYYVETLKRWMSKRNLAF